MLERIWKINRREARKLRNNKKAVFFLFLVPVIYTLLFGFLYSPHVVNNISTAVVDPAPDQLSRKIISGFEKSERFDIRYYLDDEKEALEYMNRGLVDVMVVIPEDLSRDIKGGDSGTIFFGVNASNSIIGNSAFSSATQIIKTYSAGIVMKTFEGKGLLPEEALSGALPVSLSLRPWYNPQYSYVSYLLPGIIAVALQQIVLMSAANSFAREREEGSFEEMLEEGCGIYEIAGGKMLFYFLAGVLSLFLTYFLAFTLFGIPLRGSFFYVVILGLFFYLAVVSAGLFMGLFCRNQMESMQMSMLAAYPSFLLTGYTWPAAAMPKILVFLGKFLPLTYFAGNIRDIALMGAGFEVLQKDLAALVMLSLAYLFIAIYLYRRRLLKEGYDPGEIRV